jgi:hypothetical protein
MSSENEDESILVLTGMGLAPYSARGLSQSLEVIQAATVMRRTINGELIDLSRAAFRKYRSTITCTDMQAPALNGIWPGQVLTVDCVSELAYLTAGGSPERAVVPGSMRESGDFTVYRPRLTMRVVSFSEDTDEWQAQVGWSLELEEV